MDRKQPNMEVKKDSLPDLSVVIPVFNERENLAELHERLRNTLTGLIPNYEIILVDDGSRDGSFEQMKALKEKDPRVVAVQFTRNFGQHPAIAAGLSVARGEVVVIMDADLQNPPEEIPKLLAELAQGYDVVYGVRKERKDFFFRRFSSWIAEAILRKLVGGGVKGSISAFLAVRYPFVEAFNSCTERNKFFPGLFAWLGARSSGVEVEHSNRFQGSTKYSFRKLLQLFTIMVVSFSEAPLRLSSRLGFLVALVGVILAGKVIVQRLLLEVTVPGYASLFAALVLFSGVQLFFLGILGEYLARVYVETRKRPDYFIKQILK